MMYSYKEGFKSELRNCSPVVLLSVPGNVMEQIIMRRITWRIWDNQGIKASKYGFVKGRSCLTSLISFYDKVTHSVDERQAVDVVDPDFSKAL